MVNKHAFESESGSERKRGRERARESARECEKDRGPKTSTIGRAGPSERENECERARGEEKERDLDNGVSRTKPGLVSASDGLSYFCLDYSV